MGSPLHKSASLASKYQPLDQMKRVHFRKIILTFGRPSSWWTSDDEWGHIMKVTAHSAAPLISTGLSVALSLAPGAPRAWAQSSPSNSAGGQVLSSAPRFSIETEMLTYRALESDSEAVACEVAGLLSGQPARFTSDAAGGRCSIQVEDPAEKVVLLPFENNVIPEFAVWRSDMQTMAEMLNRAGSVCDLSGNPVNPRRKGNITGLNLGAGASPEAQFALPLSGSDVQLATAVLGVFNSGYSNSPVRGTIEDQAFIDDVGRDLRVLNVTVLSPSSYMPGSLQPIEPAQSPFVTRLLALLRVHDCLLSVNGKDDPGVRNMQSFIDSLSNLSDNSTMGADQTTARNSNSSIGKSAAGSATANTGIPSHLDSDLAGDGLAHALGIHLEAGGALTTPAKVHLLLLKALESGGDVSRFSNIFGTRISYSGGSVGTYALFALDGQVECEGNVYDYAGPVPFKDFEKRLRAYQPNPSSQVIFHRGSCPAVAAAK